ncbi:tRNA-uridine aminocarboxypropyltransferase [Sulfurimonas paralvinellae]|uniref:tRNA-uridine aminocarboxypropyltransferase n=1 Tax=Sulfurimonas paralvinellae TaxID=317658 RepID=A0A7M1B886_9BACT|nr:tRNA-uridine aminocarboxypropyltransferase [Sulfurimonas paralvinellae]QOP45940.1 DTW domain-containing protein [Sulfurimonas paralvinellae]
MTLYGDREKCYRCYRPKSSCMCEYFAHIETQTKFVILMHPKEFKKVKNNTGHFTHQSLVNSELFVGIDFTDHKRVNEIIASHESYILFPSQNALNLTQTNPKSSEKPLAVFLIDSTWACTKSIFYHSKNLQNLRHMSFTTTKTSAYEIKEQPDERYLSTIESTLVVLEALNMHKIEDITNDALTSFLDPFYKMINYQKKLIKNPKSNAVRFKKR